LSYYLYHIYFYRFFETQISKFFLDLITNIILTSFEWSLLELV
jgi:hypothetical protein